MKNEFPKLLASAPTLEMLRKSIAKFFYCEPSSIVLNFVDSETEWSVSNSIRVIPLVRVIKKGKRYREEM